MQTVNIFDDLFKDSNIRSRSSNVTSAVKPIGSRIRRNRREERDNITTHNLFTPLCSCALMRLLLNSRTYSSLRGLSVKKTCSDGAPTLSFSVRSARFLKLLYMPASHPSRAPETRISISGTTHRAVRMFSNDTNATGEVSGRFTARHVWSLNSGCAWQGDDETSQYWVVNHP